jgi:protocatechuate 3,4-dioxygenase beta subunit
VTNSVGPVAGATVTATSGADDDVLSAMMCSCDNACGEKLLACACGESARQLAELVMDRRGEAPPIARTTSAADGSFLLDGLDKGAFALWAEMASAGIGLVQNVESGNSDIEVRLSDGMYIAGATQSEDHKPVAGAIVTAIYAEHSRFFDALTDADGKFRIGPVPIGRYAVVGVRKGLLPDRAQVDPARASEVKLSLYIPRRIAGKVLSNGNPVEAAQVELRGGHRRPRAATDSSGSFSFSDLRPDEYALRATQGTVVAVQEVRLQKGQDLLDVELNLGSAAELSGFVRARSLAPITGARVRLWKGNNASLAQAVTASDGSFHAPPLEPGQYSIAVSASGYRSAETLYRTVVPGAPSTVEVLLDPAASCSGAVFSREGKPIADAVVTAMKDAPGDESDDWMAERGSERFRKQRAVSRDDGGFAVDGLAPGAYRLRVEHEQYQPVEEPIVVPRDRMRFVLEEGAKLSGSVVEEDGSGVVGATVALERQRGSQEPEVVKSTFSDAEGKFSLRGVPKGDFTLVATIESNGMSSRKTSLNVSTASAGAEPVVLRFPKGLSISGTVSDADGNPIAGAEIFAARRTEKKASRREVDGQMGRATSTESGAFRIEHLESGRYAISAIKAGFDNSSDNERTVAAGDQGLRLSMRRTPHIKGRVVKPGGLPVTRFEIEGKTISDPSGAFDLPLQNLETVVHFAGSSDSKPRLIHVHAAGFAVATRAVRADALEDIDLGEIALSQGRALTGRVIDASTKTALPGVAITVRAVDDANAVRTYQRAPSALSDGQGNFAVTDAPDGAIVVGASREGYVPWESSPPPAGQLTIALSSGGRIIGTIRAKSGEPIGGLRIWAARQDGERFGSGVARADGAFEITGLAAGRYEVRVYSSRPFTPVNADVLDATAARADFVERSGGATVTLAFEEDNAPQFTSLAPGEVAAPASAKDWQKLPGFHPSNGRPDSPRFESIPPGRYTLFAGTFDENAIRFDRQLIDVSAEGEQRVSLKLPPQLPFSVPMK